MIFSVPIYIRNTARDAYINIDSLEGIYIEQQDVNKYVVKVHTKTEYEADFDCFDTKEAAVNFLQELFHDIYSKLNILKQLDVHHLNDNEIQYLETIIKNIIVSNEKSEEKKE